MLALAEFEGGICDCGFHESLTRNKANVFGFEVNHCPVCAGRAQYDRLQAKDDREEIEKLGENAPPTVPRPGDGRHVRMTMQPPRLQAAVARQELVPDEERDGGQQ